MSMKCSSRADPAVSSTTVRVGEKPNNSKLINTQQDDRKVEVIRVCEAHRDRLPRVP